VLSVLAAALVILGFVLLAIGFDAHLVETDGVETPRRLPRAAKPLGLLSLLACGVTSVVHYGWPFGLVAWAGWLAVGAIVGVAVLAVGAAVRGPLPLVSRRRKYRPNAADARDVPQ
jgi:hypothetical protein